MKNVFKFKGNFKSFLFVLAVLLILSFLYYTQLLVSELQEQSREFLGFRIKIFERNINTENSQDFSFFFQEVIQTADYPIIYTDAEGKPAYWKNVSIPDSLQYPFEQEIVEKLQRLINKFDQTNNPIPIIYQGDVLGYYHYGESRIIQRLRWLPYIEIIIVGLFILIGYAGFSSIKKSEERFIWVGMAKETAHQLGTPLSSLIGWIEYIKSSPEKCLEVMPDIERDLDRLQKVTNRFSKIGSMPDLQQEKLGVLVEELLTYFRRRLPIGENGIRLTSAVNEEIPPILVNRDLFTWVLENLIKNAVDAHQGNGGEITVWADYMNDQEIYIDVQDSGKGISAKDRKNIFKPGYSSKKRGWGLGLSLAKRIIEDYHGGKIFLKESQQEGGSTFRIVLKLKQDLNSHSDS